VGIRDTLNGFGSVPRIRVFSKRTNVF